MNDAGRPHQIQRSIRPCLNVGDDAEIAAESDFLSFRREVVKELVVSHLVLQAIVVELEMVAASVQTEAIEVTRVRCATDCRTDDEIAVVLLTEPGTVDEAEAAGGTTCFQLNSGSRKWDPGTSNSRFFASW